jgi:hypothetical protein
MQESRESLKNVKIALFSKDINKLLLLLDKSGEYDILTSLQVHTLLLTMSRSGLEDLINYLPTFQQIFLIGTYFQYSGRTFIEAFSRTPLERYIEQYNERLYSQAKEHPLA